MRRVAAAALVGVALATSGGPVLGQQAGPAAQTPVFQTSADLVQVDVVVTTADGEPVTGLRPEDFTLLDRGTPQAIDAFEEVSRERAVDPLASLPPTVEMDVADNTSARESRLVVLLLDDLNAWQGRTERVRALARTMVADLGREASMAVLFTSGDHGTEITSNRAELFGEIGKFKGWHRLPMHTPGRLCGGQGQLGDQAFWNVNSVHQTLLDVSKMLGTATAQRKAFVLISEGISMGGVDHLFDTMNDACTLSSETPYTEFAMFAMMEQMRRANVALYAIDPSALTSAASMILPEDRDRVEAEARADLNYKGFSDAHPPAASAGITATNPDDARADPVTGVDEASLLSMDRPSTGSRQYLQAVTAAAGGFAVVDAAGFDAGMTRLLTDLDHYYLLGFTPADLGKKGWRPLEVRVNRPGLVVRYRKGYDLSGPVKPPKNRDPMVGLAAGAMPSSDVPLRLFAEPLPGRGSVSHVAVAMDLVAPRDTLTLAAGHLEDTVQYTLLAVDLKKRKIVRAVRRDARVAIDPGPQRGVPSDATRYQVVTSIDLGPGSYQLRMSASSARLGRKGSVYLDVDVPDFSKGPPRLGPVLIGTVGAPPPTGESANAHGLLPFMPVLDRAFSTADTLRVFCPVLGAGDLRPDSVRLELVSPAGATLAAAAGAIHDAGADALRRGRSLQARLPLIGVSPGAYVLRLVAQVRAATLSREIGVSVY